MLYVIACYFFCDMKLLFNDDMVNFVDGIWLAHVGAWLFFWQERYSDMREMLINATASIVDSAVATLRSVGERENIANISQIENLSKVGLIWSQDIWESRCD